MFTTIMHLTMNTAMQRPLDGLLGREPRQNLPHKRSHTRTASKLGCGAPRRSVKHAILADSLRIAAGYY